MTPWLGVVGHGRVMELLSREIASPAGAYLFVGAEGVGKGRVARGFAAALVCPASAEHTEPCRSCRLVAGGAHPDVIAVGPEERQSIGVEQARATVQKAMLQPVESGRKVFLMEDAGLLTEQAANALLKTLEEPTATTVFVLVTESEDDLPVTVASRCRTVHFGRVDEAELAVALVDRGVDSDQAVAIARTSGGRPGLAFELAESEEVVGFRSAWLSVPGRLTDRPGECFVLAQEMLETTENLLPDTGEAAPQRRRARAQLLATGLEILASWYADSASVQMGGSPRNSDLAVADLAAVAPRRAVDCAERVLDAVMDLQANLRPQLLLTSLFAYLGSEDG